MFYVRQKASPFGDEEITQTAGRRHHSFRRWMHHEPLPDLWQAGDVENCQPAVANLSRICVCRDKRNPEPAITACLIVSLDPISMPMRGSMPCWARNRSANKRVPEPTSRIRMICLAISRGENAAWLEGDPAER